MALSYYSNWDNSNNTFQHELKPDIMSFYSTQPQEETHLIIPPDQLYNDDFALPDPFFDIDSFFEPNDYLLFSSPDHQQNSNAMVPYISTPPDYNYNNNETFQVNPEELIQPFHFPKRQKLNDYEQLQLFNYSGSTNELPGFSTGSTIPPVFNVGVCDESSHVTKSQTSGSSSLSAQSIAARQRRRKISEKTQELGKLIPGGHKMNTAEMFQSAYKYINYLKAQIGILEFMGKCDDHQEEGDLFRSEQLHGLLESQLIQERLYSAEKCMVPHEFVQQLANGGDDQGFDLKPHVLKEVKQLINP